MAERARQVKEAGAEAEALESSPKVALEETELPWEAIPAFQRLQTRALALAAVQVARALAMLAEQAQQEARAG